MTINRNLFRTLSTSLFRYGFCLETRFLFHFGYEKVLASHFLEKEKSSQGMALVLIYFSCSLTFEFDKSVKKNPFSLIGACVILFHQNEVV